jgi:predicted metal-dependent enzyme (double-stranded beta helix superfamily)
MTIFNLSLPDPPDGEYSRHILFSHRDLEVIAVPWGCHSCSTIHRHDSDGKIVGIVAVIDGLLCNDTYIDSIDGKIPKLLSSEEYKPGEFILLLPGTIHRMKCLSDRAQTLHFYSPSITEIVNFDDSNSKPPS